ncbi:unnamed protein product [Effrenium voratum]|uniref:Calmodulin n=1 Tax=Effrenium voratum TaxID=2562239 RepID=A0AA36JIN1_9DINO|nr:unnamed protein product [Effrenium voratum]CAJ1418437.1 unnamed protein product [Effrenium voratum]
MAANEAVQAAFRRFDVDQSGSISRDELGNILRGLDSSWTDDSIDDLLAQADASGDGQLQIDEFLKWIFAEDQDVGAAYIGEFTYSISSCSKPEMNGDYVQRPIAFNGRPIFQCFENGLHLIYHKAKKQWGIGKGPTNPPICRLRTERAPHMARANWALWQEGRKAYVRESRMSCGFKRSPEEVEAACEKAPEIIHHVCVEGEALGLFRKQGEIVNERPVYLHDKTGMFLSYDKELQKWKVSKEPNASCKGVHFSELTKAYSPIKAVWKSEGETVLWGTPQPSSCVAIPEGWKDPDFPPDASSIGNMKESRCAAKRGASREIEWVRALTMSKQRTPLYEPVLFGDITPADALQGAVGNCWMIAAFAQMAEFPSYIKEHIFITKEISPDGKYEFRLFDFKAKDWTVVQVDDYLPCFASDRATADVAYADLNDGKMWVALLEKALAKQFGSYARINGGISEVVYAMLTGCDNHFSIGPRVTGDKPIWVITAEDGVPVRGKEERLAAGARIQELRIVGGYQLKFTKVDGEGPDEGVIEYYMAGKPMARRETKFPWCHFVQHVYDKEANKHMKIEDIDDDQAWAKALEAEEKNFLLSACPFDYASDGVVSSHVYSVLALKQVGALRFVCMRNPWGRGEWKGPWHEGGEELKANPDVAEALQVDLDNDGKFWIEWEDYKWRVKNFAATMFPMATRRGRERLGEDVD